MNNTVKIVSNFRQVCVRPVRHSVRILAVAMAMVMGFGGNFLETSPDLGNVVEQIHATLERREEIKDLAL